MSIKLWTTLINKLWLWNTEIKKIYLWNTQIFASSVPITVDTTSNFTETYHWYWVPYTWSHTCSWNNRILFVNIKDWVPSSVTYNWVWLTMIASTSVYWVFSHSLWYLINPPTWTYQVSVTVQSTWNWVASAVSYNWVSQTSPITTYNNASNWAWAMANTLTSTVDNSWHILWIWADNVSITAWANTTLRNSNWKSAILDWNWPITPAWSNTINVNCSTYFWYCWAIFKPA